MRHGLGRLDALAGRTDVTIPEGPRPPSGELNDRANPGALVVAMNADDTNARFHVGSTIAGRYRVERPIGEGAMGAVALARHVTLDETVAIKFLRPELRRDPVATA